MDPFIAGKLVAGKQSELRAEAKRAALREDLPRHSHATDDRRLFMQAMHAAGRLAHHYVTQVWNGGVRRFAASARASR